MRLLAKEVTAMSKTKLVPKSQRPKPEDYPISLFDGVPDHLVWDSRGRVILFVCQPPPAVEGGEVPKDLIEEVDPEFYAYIRGLPSSYVPSIELVYGLDARNHPELIQKYEQYVGKCQDYIHHTDLAATVILKEESDL